MVRWRTTAVSLLLQWKDSPAALYAASLGMAAVMAILMVVLPWRIMALGGREIAVGASGGLLMGVYILSCLLIRPHLDRIGVKRLVVASSALTAGNGLLLATASTVPAVLGLVCLQALVLGAFWSPLTGWLSGTHEGGELSRRLTQFSFFWAAGNILGASAGGPLLNADWRLPFLVISAAAAGIGLLAALAHQDRAVVAIENHAQDRSAENAFPLLPAFRRAARLGLLCSCLGMGLLRGPLASLLEQMTTTARQGAEMTSLILGLSGGVQMLCFFLLGRTEKWHYRASLLLGVQVFGAAMLIGVAAAQQVSVAGFCAAATMIATSYLYSSHVYYTLSGGMGRAAGMALHEIVLSIGFTIGSMGGGLIGHLWNIRWSFALGAVVWTAGIVGQAAISLRRRNSFSGGGNSEPYSRSSGVSAGGCPVRR